MRSMLKAARYHCEQMAGDRCRYESMQVNGKDIAAPIKRFEDPHSALLWILSAPVFCLDSGECEEMRLPRGILEGRGVTSRVSQCCRQCVWQA